MKLRPRQSAQTELDISPLIDVVFILLIFFMVSTTFIKDFEIDLERPSAASAAPASTKALRVYVDRHAQFWVQETPVKAWMLQSRVREHLRSSGQGDVVVVTDQQVPASKLIEAVDACRLAGASHVGVVTEAEVAG